MHVFFFFSSRRRHTRLQGDWSSDVCSSDLHGSSARWTNSSTAKACGCSTPCRSEEHTSELQSPCNLVCRLLLEKKKKKKILQLYVTRIVTTDIDKTRRDPDDIHTH